MADVKKLREEVIKRHKAASDKIARIQRSTGAKVSGSEFDVRRDLSNVKRYNARQLNAYLGELNNFMRRGNQFVAGTRGAPIFKGSYERYKRIETEYEQARLAHDKSVGDVVTPSGMTVRQNKAALPEAHGSAVYGPYRKFDRMPSEIAGQKAIEKLSQDLIKKSIASYLPTKIQEGRDNLIKALEYLGEDDAVDAILGLTDYQFDLLWFGTFVAEAIFGKYDREKEKENNEDTRTRKERWQDKVVDSVAGELPDVLEWASNQPKERPANRPEPTEKIRGFKR